MKKIEEKVIEDDNQRYNVLVFATRKFLTFRDKSEAVKLKVQLNALGFEADIYYSSTANLGVY